MQWTSAVAALTTLYIVVYNVQSSSLCVVSLEPHSDPPRMGELLSISILYLKGSLIGNWNSNPDLPPECMFFPQCQSHLLVLVILDIA